MTPELTIVVPVYFNEKSVAGVVAATADEWRKAGRDSSLLEYVLVDDGSKDDSWRVLESIRASHPNVTTIRLGRNHGSQLAILAGCSIARGRRIAMVAADGQEPADLPVRMFAAAEEGARAVLAVRRSRADDLRTRASSGLFYRIVRRLGLEEMPPEGFDAFLLDREVVEIILEMRDPNIPLSVTIAWLGFDTREIPYERLARTEGKSRWTFRKKTKLALDAITAISFAPIRAISLAGIVVALIGFLYAGFVTVMWMLHRIPVAGWTSLFVAVLVLGGMQLTALGVIGEYLWRTLEVARRRPLWRIVEMHGPKD